MTTRLERAAIAGFLAFQHDVAPEGRTSWDDVPEEMRVTFRMVADAVLMTDGAPMEQHEHTIIVGGVCVGCGENVGPPGAQSSD